MNRKPITLCFALVCAYTMFSSCKKDGSPAGPIPEYEIRLNRIEMDVQQSTYKYVLSYDAEGRISEVSHESNTAPSTVLFKVVYDGNHILLTRPMGEEFDMAVADTIRIDLGAGGIVLSRIQNRFVQIWGSDESRNYINDTSYFEYNANGLLLKLTHHFKDSTWNSSSGSGPERSKVIRKIELADYTIEGNSLVSVYKRGDVSETTYIDLDTSIANTVEETTSTFDYAKAYANKIDFSNAAVLNELHAFTDLPLNKKHNYLPNKVHTTKTRKNKDGVVFSTTSVIAQSDFKYDTNGFVVSKEDPSNPGTKVLYWY